MLLGKTAFTMIRPKYLQLHQIIRKYQVTVLNGASDIGQTVCLMLRTHPFVETLVLHDTEEQIQGIALDVSHVPSKGELKVYTGYDTLLRALKGTDLVLAIGNTIRNTGSSEKSLIEMNTEFIKRVAKNVAKVIPTPFIGIAAEPINSMVPMAAEIMKNYGANQSKKLLGITGIDVLRAQTMYAAWNGLNSQTVSVPVIGGHSEKTLIPLVSHAEPSSKMADSDLYDYTTGVCKGQKTVMEAKGGWAPSVSIAHSIVLFATSILNALDGRHVNLHAYVENNDYSTSFFAGLVSLNKYGVTFMHKYTNLTSYEVILLERAIEVLRKDVMTGKRILQYS